MSTIAASNQQSLMILRTFIRNLKSLLSTKDNPLFHTIPQPVIDLILLFTGNIFDNQGSYTWKITDKQIVNQILTSKNGHKFSSEPFIICRIQCQLKIYPNGNNPDLSGYFLIYLQILSLPKYIRSINIGCIRKQSKCWLSR